MLISVEGLDGVGKSTVSNAIATCLNIPLVEKPIKKLLYIGDEQSKQITEKIYGCYSSNIQAMYYLMGYLSVLEDSKRNDLLMDRGFLSTYYFSYNQENSPLFDFFVNNYGLPDITVVLYASIDERINRIRKRSNSDSDLKKKRIYRDGYDKIFEGLQRYNFPYLLINTENLSELETSKLVLRLLKLFIENPQSIDGIKEIFSIDNLSNVGNLSFDEISDIIDNKIHKQCTKEKTMILRRSERNEKINNK